MPRPTPSLCLPVVAALVLLIVAGPLVAGVAMERLKPAGENLLKADAWRPYDQGFARDGEVFVCDNGADAAARRGVCQTVVLNQAEPEPIVATAFSKAEGVGGGADADYSLYLDLLYQDGTPCRGQIGPFRTGTHDWQRAEVVVFPAKPVKHLSYYLLLRGHAGKAAFKDPQLVAMKVPEGAALFDGVPVRLKAPAAAQFLVRDVAAGSDFVTFDAGEALWLRGECQVERRADADVLSARLTDMTGKDRAVTLVYTVPVAAKDAVWLADPRREVAARPPHEYTAALRAGNVGANGMLSRWPLAAVAAEGRDAAVAIDMARPAFFRVGYSAGAGALYVAYDLALTKEKPAAEVRLAHFGFDAAWGFRAAVARLYEVFPDQFRSRTPEQGLWMPFFKISQVQGWEDFGFKFKEGNDETAWDDAHGITTFRYTEPMTCWMPMAKDLPRTYEAALAEAKRLAEKGNAAARALLASGHHDDAGRFAARLRDTPWCNGAVWSMNSSPGIAGEVTDFRIKWSPAIRDRLYGPDRKGDLDGEYVDSCEGYVTDVLDFRREHFAGQDTPLVFASDTHRPAVFRGLIAFEYTRAIERDMRRLGKLMMANGAPGRLCWLSPLLDVLGTETNWNPGGRWRPMTDEELLYRRVLAGPKPYCFLMNTDFDKMPHETVAKYMKRCVAYGMFPGFFSHNASEGHYFSRADLYNRDRPLFKTYVPLAKRVAEAGWRPVTGVRSSDPRVYVERWGERYLTVFNDSPDQRAATLTLDGLGAPKPGRELVAGRDVAWTGGKTEIRLGPEDVAVIDLAPFPER